MNYQEGFGNPELSHIYTNVAWKWKARFPLLIILICALRFEETDMFSTHTVCHITMHEHKHTSL